MVHKINTKARIQRHLRIYNDSTVQTSNNAGTFKKSVSSFNFNFVFLIVVVLFPFYPTVASFVHGSNEYEFDRWDIDVDSILSAYFSDGEDFSDEQFNNAPIISQSDTFLSINTLLNDDRDLTGTNEIIDYEVQSGESFSTIASKHQVTASSIMWANNFTASHVLQPGELIKIPPVTGIIYTVKSGDNVAKIAKSYSIEESDILEQNLLASNQELKVWEELVLPGAKKKIIITKKPQVPASTSWNTGYWFTTAANSKYVSATGKYNLVWRKPYSWVAGNCTWYVASYKNVDWRGNANQWLRNARAKWHPTGSTPQTWAIVVLDGRWYNPWYGHVAIVMEVKADSLVVSDMNYRRLYEVTYREIPKNDRAIQWYIYVD
mgnify:CR=1 FL=1